MWDHKELIDMENLNQENIWRFVNNAYIVWHMLWMSELYSSKNKLDSDINKYIIINHIVQTIV